MVKVSVGTIEPIDAARLRGFAEPPATEAPAADAAEMLRASSALWDVLRKVPLYRLQQVQVVDPAIGDALMGVRKAMR